MVQYDMAWYVSVCDYISQKITGHLKPLTSVLMRYELKVTNYSLFFHAIVICVSTAGL